MSNNVQHPQHYNAHPAGIECIDVIRHYTCDIANAIKYLWRAGLKPEQGMDDAEKEIEDLKKALFYIDDYRQHHKHVRKGECDTETMLCRIRKVTGHTASQIAGGYPKPIDDAMTLLLAVGIVEDGKVYADICWDVCLEQATAAIQHRILAIETAMTQKELDSTLQTLHGQVIDGEDYISKPACRRPTEPEHYDPLNIIILQGTAYCLSSEPKKKENGALYSPCDLCALRYDCISDGGTEPFRSLCQLHQATNQEYYREVGRAKYAPAFGTIEVVDEMKELELEKKRLEEEDEDEE